MLRINLLPLKVRKTKIAVQLYTYFLIAASVLGIVLILLFLNLLLQTRRLDAKLEKLKVAEVTLADQLGPLRGLARQEQRLAELKDMIRVLGAEQGIWINILDDLADQVQDDMWLTRLASERKQEADPLRLTLAGEAFHKISVADFLTMLENSTRFAEVSLEDLSETMVGGTPQVQFKLKMRYADLQAPAQARQP